MARLKDIASEAGVSIVTVSNVINGNYKKVSDKKIHEIQEIIRKYDYVPNATARSLAAKKSNIIGVVIPYVTKDENFLQSPYNAQVLSVIEKVVRGKGYYLMVRCVEGCGEIIPVIRTWNVDGVIFLGAYRKEAEELKKDLKLPMVFMDTYTNDENISNIIVDDFKGGYIAAKYLINKGHRSICFAGPNHQDENVVQKICSGYVSAMKESGLEKFIVSETAGSTSFDCGLDVGRKIGFYKTPVTAVFATADILALGIIQGLRLSGKRVPEDISVIGYDNLPECRYSEPALTTINQNIAVKAQRAAEMLFDQIIDGTVIPREEVDVELIERQSVVAKGQYL